MSFDLTKTQKHLDWLKTKLYLDFNSYHAVNRVVKRGEVYWYHVGYNIGNELSKETPRPCVILQKSFINKHSSNVIVAPITHSASILPCLVPIKSRFSSSGKTILDGNINVSGLMCVSKIRLTEYICTLSKEELKAIDEALAQQLDLYDRYMELKKENEQKQTYISKLLKERNSLRDHMRMIQKAAETTDISQIILRIKNGAENK